MNAPLSVAIYWSVGKTWCVLKLPEMKVSAAGGGRGTELVTSKPWLCLRETARLYRSSQCKLRMRYCCLSPIPFVSSGDGEFPPLLRPAYGGTAQAALEALAIPERRCIARWGQ